GMRASEVDRAVFEVDNDPVETLRHDPHRLEARDGGDRAEGRPPLAPFLAQTVERGGRSGHIEAPGLVLKHDLFGNPVPTFPDHACDQAGTRPPKKGISASLSVWRLFEVKIIFAA